MDSSGGSEGSFGIAICEPAASSDGTCMLPTLIIALTAHVQVIIFSEPETLEEAFFGDLMDRAIGSGKDVDDAQLHLQGEDVDYTTMLRLSGVIVVDPVKDPVKDSVKDPVKMALFPASLERYLRPGFPHLQAARPLLLHSQFGPFVASRHAS
ncbi:hypothetical protein BV898_06921 [Hypsibius exemplaris]|uniref:Uncharacterized protein n=1 Tax=Hypsibius exemplaris TaxID=2072580 RepID=A0A1W0WV31_HYPEX|nr:hypothetical protein BV898_06921 [Hypsibius exemplaris]